MVAMSIKSLGVNTYGLDYAAITKTINQEVYSSGFHFIGFMHQFIEYPATYQTLDFSESSGAARGSIDARSKDGLMVSFRANF
jgi:hypothetical protein